MLAPESETHLSFLDQKFKVVRKSGFRGIRVRFASNGSAEVIASTRCPRKNLQAFLEEQTAWIKRQIERLQDDPPSVGKTATDGEIYLFLGVPRKLKIELGAPFKVKAVEVSVKKDNLIVVASKYSNQKILNSIREFYKSESKSILDQLIEIRSQELRLAYQKVIYRSQTTRWGSCGPNGTISLNWKLAVAPLPVMDYVVVHELAHLVHPNHSQKFWKFVASVVPNHKQHTQWLRSNAREFDFLTEFPRTISSPLKQVPGI